MGPILFLYYKESLVSSNLNAKAFMFHGVRPNLRTSYGARFPSPSVSNKNVPDSRFPILAMYEHDDPLSFVFSKWPMEKIPKFNKRRAFNKTVGPGKKSEFDKRRAYVYSGL